MTKTSKNRPLSPHLTIYKPQITSVLSISHRLTGVVLLGAVWLFCVWIALNVYGCSFCINSLIRSCVGQVFLVLFSMALFYHLCNGVRHLVWDSGKGISNACVNKSGVAVILMTIFLTVIAWMAAYGLDLATLISIFNGA